MAGKILTRPSGDSKPLTKVEALARECSDLRAALAFLLLASDATQRHDNPAQLNKARTLARLALKAAR